VSVVVLLATLVSVGGGFPASAHSGIRAPLPVLGASGSSPPLRANVHPSPRTGGVGSVVDTIDLVTNQLLPGNQAPGDLGSPQMILYDTATGDLYVRGADGASIGVVDASSGKVLAALVAGIAGSAYIPNVPTMVVDTTNGNLYEANPSAETVGVISTSTNQLTETIRLGAAPGGIVFDPANGNLYTSNWQSNNVSVISGATNRLVASIAVGSEPGALLYDPLDARVFVSNFNSGNVSVLDTTSESVLASPVTGAHSSEPVALTLNTKDDLVNLVNSLSGNVSVINGSSFAVQSVVVGSVPTSATYVPGTDTLLVANGASNNVTVLQQPGDASIASIPIGHGAQGAAYDPVNGYVYTANYGTNDVSVIDPSTHTTKANVTTMNFPETLAVDTSSGNIYVANEGTFSVDANLTVISGSSSASIGSVRLNTYPTNLVVAPGGSLFSTDYGGQGADILSTATNLETAFASTAPEPDDTAFDPVTSQYYIASEPSGAVTVVTATGTLLTTVALGFGSEGVAYDPANGEVYVSNYYSGNVTLINGTTHAVDRVITTTPFDSLGAEIYDPASSSMYVADYSSHNVTVLRGNVTNGSIQVGTDPSSFAYDPSNGTIFVANYGSGNLSVIDASTNQVAGQISGYFPEYLAFDSTNNSVYVASAENGEVDAFNATTYASLGTPLDINSSVRSGGIAYSASSNDVYVSNVYVGTIAVISQTTVPTYPVVFDESGLPFSTPWTVTLNGVSNGSSTASIGFAEPPGSYTYTVGAITGYTASPSGGGVTVSSSGQTILISFTAPLPKGKYAVDFQEQGLPAGTPWAVTLNGSSLGSSISFINFSESNGSYTYSVGAVPEYRASPGSGPITVAGRNQSVSIQFVAAPAALSVTLTADPATLNLHNSTVLTASILGGTSPYSLVYSGLPTGCSTGNTTSLSCDPTATGSFRVTVTVTDHSGKTAEANATVTVQASGPSTSSSSSTNLPWDWIIVGVAILALLLLLLLLLARRRRAKSEPAAAAPAPPAPPASGPP
jgi:MYXO-CTERM domain-containing protein